MSDLKTIIENSFTQYAGAVLQSRALVDVRDGLKPSARQIFYSMVLHKLTSDKPHKKTMNAVGMSMADFYIHGDASCVGIIMRAGQNFALRYPLVDVKGNCGSLIESGNWAAPRYTESRLSNISTLLFKDINKNTISEWRDNYDNTKQYPAVLPSKGFYNLCNGTQGVGIGMASSVPQFNLREMNNALIYLIDHPDCDFEDIYIAPDFATGGILYNESEVKESLKNGTGAACKLRSVVDFNSGERCFIVKEIPFSVYTNTICSQLEAIIESEENPGIERFNDLTGEKPLIKIYLTKKANPDKVLNYLYKNTSLQYYYGINFTMLDQGRFPKVFTWKEALQAHIEHEKEVYRRSFEFDLKEILDRLHIIEGLLICLAHIDEVVQTIKHSSSTQTAAKALCENFLLDDIQAKAVLDMKLARLAHLEVEKLEKEKTDLNKEKNKIEMILNNAELFNNELKKGWKEVADKYGDARRTKILNLSTENNEPIEIKQLQVSLTNKNNLYVNESSTLYTQRRGGVGNKLKLENGEYVINSQTINTNDNLLFFTQNGNVYQLNAESLSTEIKFALAALIPIKDYETVRAFVACSQNKPYICFITQKGYIKKSEMTEYKMTRNIGIRAINLEDNDEIVSVLFSNDENVGILTEKGNFINISTTDIRPIGRMARGVAAIKLNTDDHVIAAHIIPSSTKEIISISGNGLIKRMNISEFNIQGRNTKGSKIQKLLNEDWMADFLPIESETEILIASTRSAIKINLSEVPLCSKGAQGIQSIKLNAIDNIVQLFAC